MSELIKYYSGVLDKLNKEYKKNTEKYVEEFVEFKIPLFRCSLNANDLNSQTCINNNTPNAIFTRTTTNLKNLNIEYLNLSKELKALFDEQSKYVTLFQKKIDVLNEENKKLKDRMQEDCLLYAVVSIADKDGVAVADVAKRGFEDLCLRLAKGQLDADSMKR